MGSSGRPSCRIAVYGEIDPNLVDGSSVWLQSICQVLASLEGVEVTLLLRRPPEPGRRFLLAELEAVEGVELVDSGRPDLLTAVQALDLLDELDRERGPFDLVLLRGQDVLAEAAERESFAGRLWSYAMTGRGMSDATLRALASHSQRLLCQTGAVADELREIVPDADSSLLLVLPPMVPDSPRPVARAGEGGSLRLAYAGKLAPEYCWLETVAAFEALREAQPTAELHVLGDKIHRPPDRPGFHEEAKRALIETEGMRWHGALPRQAVQGVLADCDLALSIRDPSVEAAREISTKVLEYGAAGLPVVLNRAPAYENLLGEDYPLFVEGPTDAAALLTGPALDPNVRKVAADACHAASRGFTFARVAERVAGHLPRVGGQPSSDAVSIPLLAVSDASVQRTNGSARCRRAATRVLVAGHDLKFVGPIRDAIVSTGATIAEDVWNNHAEHDETASRAALAQADVVFCEWCLGNAAWYSHNKRHDQRLVIRLHRVEAYTDHPAAVEIGNVDKVVCVSRHIADEAIARFGWDPAKLQVIPNSVDVERFRLPKLGGADHTLAMVGYVPKRKRLDRALDVLEAVRRRDSRFCLMLIGHPPSKHRWIYRKPEEIDYFRQCFTRVQETPHLRGFVSFHPFTEDLPTALQRVGFILSMSDSEGHQVSLAEGAASGAVPIVLDRPGAVDQYPSKWVHATPEEAAVATVGLQLDGWRSEQILAADHAAAWARDRVLPSWVETLGLRNPPGLDREPERVVLDVDLEW